MGRHRIKEKKVDIISVDELDVPSMAEAEYTRGRWSGGRMHPHMPWMLMDPRFLRPGEVVGLAKITLRTRGAPQHQVDTYLRPCS